MAIRLKFDPTKNLETPAFVLATKSGVKIGRLPVCGLNMKDCLNAAAELSFSIHKADCKNGTWDQTTDFKLLWAREWNKWFEITVDIDETDDLIKNVSAVGLGQAELSQINVYEIEANTDIDIEREDYAPTVLYNHSNPKLSLLDRLIEKAPHYTIGHVDSSLASLQRAFSFDETDILSAFNEISQELNCLFQIDCYTNAEGNITREINVYDLEAYCYECGSRGNFLDACDECGSTNIKPGYGEDTTIFVTSENLADNINYETNTDSVKNCFKLKGGDDTITAAIANCNPNGSPYLWFISDALKGDMSDDLVSRLAEYDSLYNYYQTDHVITVDADLRTAYNALIDKYWQYTNDYPHISNTIVGFPNLIKAYSEALDFRYYLESLFKPLQTATRTTAGLEGAKLNSIALSPVALQNVNNLSGNSASSAVLAMAKTIISPDYSVSIKESVIDTSNGNRWIGKFTVVNSKDETDTATTGNVSVTLTDDFETLVKQKIYKALNNKRADFPDIIKMFNYPLEGFIAEIKKYSLENLEELIDSCQSVLDLLIESGVSDKDTWEQQPNDLYRRMYTPYYNYLQVLQEEKKIRTSEISVIMGAFDRSGKLIQDGIYTFLDAHRTSIQKTLDFANFLGADLYKELSSYRREDIYQNSNYISEGLTNSELLSNAIEFIQTAKKEIYKSATMQHSISASLKNLLVMHEFEPLLDKFEVGNWIRIRVDGKVYQLRLLEYDLSFDNLDSLSVTFSDVKITGNQALSDLESITAQAANMATSYDIVSRQASNGQRSNEQLADWVNKGLALTKMKIVDSADNQNITWDNHGLLCREYIPATDTYDGKQLKIINKGLFLTDDNWQTSKAGIGNFAFWNPVTEQMEESYGVIADTLVGNLILSERVGIYNTKNSIKMDENGVTITSDNRTNGENQTVFTIEKLDYNADNEETITRQLYIDSNGNLVINGSIRVNSGGESGDMTLDELTDASRYTEVFNNLIDNSLHGENGVYSTMNQYYLDAKEYSDMMLDGYKAEVGQYMSFGSDGLTLGAANSAFKTVIDNQRLAFYDGDAVAAYISNNQLYIPQAVIQSTLMIGDFFFSPRADGGVSLTWQGN